MSTQAVTTGARVPPARIVGGAGIAFAASVAIQNAETRDPAKHYPVQVALLAAG